MFRPCIPDSLRQMFPPGASTMCLSDVLCRVRGIIGSTPGVLNRYWCCRLRPITKIRSSRRQRAPGRQHCSMQLSNCSRSFYASMPKNNRYRGICSFLILAARELWTVLEGGSIVAPGVSCHFRSEKDRPKILLSLILAPSLLGRLLSPSNRY